MTVTIFLQKPAIKQRKTFVQCTSEPKESAKN